MHPFYLHLATAIVTVHALPESQGHLDKTAKIPYNVRKYWMRQANDALLQLTGTPCPFAAFGTVIVNHTSSSTYGDVICTGANSGQRTGNPVNHGEIVAINNCTAILTDRNGPYKLTPAAAQLAFADLSLYTNGESCPMCASAIRWAHFKECIYGSSIDSLVKMGWDQIDIPSREVFQRSTGLGAPTALLGNVLTSETDPLFSWQFNANSPCPARCSRNKAGSCAYNG